MHERPRVWLCLKRFARLASSEVVEGALDQIEGFETASTQNDKDCEFPLV